MAQSQIKSKNRLSTAPLSEAVLSSLASINRLPVFRPPLQWYIFSDCMALIAGFITAWILIASISSVTEFAAPDFTFGRLIQFMILAIAVIAWLQHTKHYRIRLPYWNEIKEILVTAAFALLVDGFISFSLGHTDARLLVIIMWASIGVYMVIMRMATRYLLIRAGMFQIPTLLIGAGATAERACRGIETERSLGYVVTNKIEDLYSIYNKEPRFWEKLCAKNKARYVLIALDGQKLTEADDAIAQLMRENVPFSISTVMRHLPVQGMIPQYILNHNALLLTRANGLDELIPRSIKRSFDVLVSLCMIALLSPLLLALALIVKSDGGPAFYGHTRLGRKGKTFDCLKFRSMVTNGDTVLENHLATHPEARQEWEDTRKLHNDPRVTKIGAFLRKSSLDELPQLINVLKGEMSLVGPRPIVADEICKYDLDIAHYYRVAPGITGMWQVSGRSDVSYEERVEMDTWYVRNWTLWHDIAILFKTIPALAKRSGAR
ncbi:MAG: undecaprenyl-phosphate galactose phosphotransferase WbaP [Alphaproteobacteria bacterium]|nr:undecaprenyl-phosphate galactose phosphotransferase WbaP [Alphaproteobacteria bacterium]